jgi:hypothetical protein
VRHVYVHCQLGYARYVQDGCCCVFRFSTAAHVYQQTRSSDHGLWPSRACCTFSTCGDGVFVTASCCGLARLNLDPR